MTTSTTSPAHVGTGGDQPPTGARLRDALTNPLWLSVLGAAVWTVALTFAEPPFTDIGLVSAIPPPAFIAFPLLIAGFIGGLRRGARAPEMTVHIAATIWVLFGAAPLVEGTLRLEAAWRHLGIAEYIGRTGIVDPTIDAYFNWPGYFEITAFLSAITGQDFAALAPWAPVFYNALYLAPLVAIGRTVTRDERMAWLGAWFFYLTNWVGQDYFAPQAFGMFLFLVTAAVMLRYFAPDADRRGFLLGWLGPTRPVGAVELDRRARGIVAGLIILAFVVMVSAHQLTPFATILGVLALTWIGRFRLAELPVLMGLITAAWAIFVADAFLAGNFSRLTDALFSLTGTASENVGERITGSAAHTAIIWLRIAASGAVFLLAFAGLMRARRHGARLASVALLTGSPALLIALQPYGGEMILRIYLFALPFAAVLIAALVMTGAGPNLSRGTIRAIAILSAIMIAIFPLTRYGNERAESFTEADIAAAEAMYDMAPPGSLLIAAQRNVPWKSEGYADHTHRLIVDLSPSETLDRVPTIEDVFEVLSQNDARPAFIIITPSMRAQADLFGMLPAAGFSQLERELDARAWAVYRAAGATIYRVPDVVAEQEAAP